MDTIAVIDYGMGNLMSVKKALDYVAPNKRVILTQDKDIIASADKLVFPGQGAIGGCMQAIKQHGLHDTLKHCIEEKPFLGICLGLQMLFDTCEENNGVDGLGIVAGSVKKFPESELKVPQIGWNEVHQTREHPLWHNIEQDARFYTVHSYYATAHDQDIICGSTNYGITYTSAIAHRYLFAVQFHPEKSQQPGLSLLTNFSHWQGK